MSLLSPPGASAMISTSIYGRILLRLQSEARSKRKRTMAWIELVRNPVHGGEIRIRAWNINEIKLHQKFETWGII